MSDSLMEILDAAAFGEDRYQITPAEINLILSAEQWLRDNGWEHHWIRGWSTDKLAFNAYPAGGLVIRDRPYGIWDAEGVRYPVRNVVAGLNTLVNEGILPARFSTFGSKALADFAEALERSAEHLDPNGPGGSYAEAQADALRHAAEVARQHNPNAAFA